MCLNLLKEKIEQPVYIKIIDKIFHFVIGM